MATLQEFLNKNKGIKNLTCEFPLSKRISDENGNPYLFKIKTIDNKEYEEIRNKSTKFINSSKTNNIHFDIASFNINLIIRATLNPNFKDAESIKQLNAVTPEQYVNSVLLPGEINKLVSKIQEFNGFGESIDDLTEQAKN